MEYSKCNEVLPAGPLRLFVRNLSPSSKKTDVLTYFRQFGPVAIVRLADVPSEEGLSKKRSVRGGKATNDLKRGFCILETPSLATFEKILDRCSGASFSNHILGVTPFCSGESLGVYYAEVHSMRVVLKGVPIEASLEEIKSQINFMFGPVIRIHYLKSTATSEPVEYGRSISGKHVLCLVELESKKMAQLALEVGYVWIMNCRCIIERFARPDSRRKTATFGNPELGPLYEERGQGLIVTPATNNSSPTNKSYHIYSSQRMNHTSDEVRFNLSTHGSLHK